MLIAGFQKTSFVDYPGRIAAVVFTPRCNMRCTYCHNRQIIDGDVALYDNEQVLVYLDRRKGLLDAVVITGGEPTLQRDLGGFARTIKDMGYLVKLDTNGTAPELLRQMISDGLVDYVAMDVKAPLNRYRDITTTNDNMDAIRKSIMILKNSGVEYEFRTTFAPALTAEDIEQIARELLGAKRYYLQQYRVRDALDPAPHTPSELREAAERAKAVLGMCETRGL